MILTLSINGYLMILRVSLVEQELFTLPEHLSSPPVFSGVRVTRSIVLYVMFCRSLFVLLYFFFWPLCCLFFDIRILITLLVSSNSSYMYIISFLSNNYPINIAGIPPKWVSSGERNKYLNDGT